ncbi:riboflavin biosynthesis protein RibF [Levilactobacillus bambusae]|uniref:Riboflavin biosynthesis protein n=1 Tax=Levilactobacillus bambusae TaxID=2024736 RepID=A0A2V1N239_9LACO|nr:riboflavin biosynthesis protein RibF [Levilactobacillus bambusae]PWG00738.1 riboflavin biosynthesis protein RibF [Levilactobacillus bambusae]
MEIYSIHYPMDPAPLPSGPVVLAMGFFDGVHRGHQAVIHQAKQIAEQMGLPLAVLTYNHHPALVFRPVEPEDMQYLTLPTDKMEHFESLGVDRVFVADFTGQFAAQSPQQFVDDCLMRLHPATVVAGFDHTYGPKEVATMANLPAYAQSRFNVVTVTELDEANQKISSSRIRRALDAGDVDAANDLLGYQYVTHGLVVHGEARGRTMGFPTANIFHDAGTWLPGVGVYVAEIEVGGHWYETMTSVGYNVTFGDDRPLTVEMNLLDFHGNLYGERVNVRWQHRLRGEVKFETVDELVAQLEKDRQNTRDYVEKNL